MTGFTVRLDEETVEVEAGETVAEFRERFGRDPDGAIDVLDKEGDPWRYLYPEYVIQEHMPSGHRVVFYEDGSEAY
ncbi:hypothetical protein G3I44_14145 [Halogeometricum borinquense]|uniref:Uncharacterized protein n=1 Tax=Halogeometricum borinquense TaxID=60847 RepID=A0A6C0UQV4_9EURY|nr:hypothetical protein [Halogeometricum borinquense]QIB75328.1 hypothetical protein G3I44_14145 [Halogeometricum borinquense]